MSDKEQSLFQQIFEAGKDIGQKIWDSTNAVPPSGGLNDFISFVKTEGIAVTSRYAIEIHYPAVIRDNKDRQKSIFDGPASDGDSNKIISLLCKHATVPPLSIMTNPVTIDGTVYHSPYQVDMGNANFSFYCDSGLKVKHFFDVWMDGIYRNLNSKREFQYFNNYATKITIYIFDQRKVDDNEKSHVYKVELLDAYPIYLSELDLDSSGTRPLEFSVNFCYREWKATRHKLDKDKIGNFFDRLFGDKPWYQGSALQGMGEFMNSVDDVVNDTDTFLGRIERLKGMEKGLKTQLKSVPAIFKGKVTRIKDLGKGL